MELIIAVAICGLALVIITSNRTLLKTATGIVMRLTPAWVKRVIFGDYVMWVAVGFFAIMLVVLTKVFGP